MRLLNTSTLQFKEFLGRTPKYAILSHVWSDEEVSYDDFLAGRGKGGYGYEKILKLCEISKDSRLMSNLDLMPFEWAWIDTCCIDKRSSAELSEAINSMYEWYRDAEACFVFLPDVHPLPNDVAASSPSSDSGDATFSEPEFRKSKWFTRGWTLQELLAPNRVFFYNTNFELIGLTHGLYGSPTSFSRLISQSTNIHQRAVGGRFHRGHYTIAQRMSWVSKRETTREEDLAYCLLGIFDVNMPLLYGEGIEKAFLRLQSQILASDGDDSIFAWPANYPTALFDGPVTPKRIALHVYQERTEWTGLLASHPCQFQGCGDITLLSPQLGNVALMETSQPSTLSALSRLQTSMPSITARGLELSIAISDSDQRSSVTRLIYPLMCQRVGRRRIYVKIWINQEPELMRQYGDGALQAWRSGCIAPCVGYDVDLPWAAVDGHYVAVANRRYHALSTEFCGSRKLEFLHLSYRERLLRDRQNRNKTTESEDSSHQAGDNVWTQSLSSQLSAQSNVAAQQQTHLHLYFTLRDIWDLASNTGQPRLILRSR